MKNTNYVVILSVGLISYFLDFVLFLIAFTDILLIQVRPPIMPEQTITRYLRVLNIRSTIFFSFELVSVVHKIKLHGTN